MRLKLIMKNIIDNHGEFIVDMDSVDFHDQEFYNFNEAHYEKHLGNKSSYEEENYFRNLDEDSAEDSLI